VIEANTYMSRFVGIWRGSVVAANFTNENRYWTKLTSLVSAPNALALDKSPRPLDTRHAPLDVAGYIYMSLTTVGADRDEGDDVRRERRNGVRSRR
jgi:hypothetical protein